MRKTIPAPERFWQKVVKTDECWLWTGSTDRKGYGHFRVGPGAYMLAHRYSFQLSGGDLRAEVDHRCHTPAHVRPSHLQSMGHVANCENLKGAHRDSSTGVRGVSWDKNRQRYAVQVTHLGRNHHGGRFDNLDEATEAARELRLLLHRNNLLDRASA